MTDCQFFDYPEIAMNSQKLNLKIKLIAIILNNIYRYLLKIFFPIKKLYFSIIFPNSKNQIIMRSMRQEREREGGREGIPTT